MYIIHWAYLREQYESFYSSAFCFSLNERSALLCCVPLRSVRFCCVPLFYILHANDHANKHGSARHTDLADRCGGQ